MLGMLCPTLGLKVFPGKVCIVTKKRTVGPWCSDGASWGRILNKQFAFKPLSQSLCWGDLAVGQGLTFTPVQGH